MGIAMKDVVREGTVRPTNATPMIGAQELHGEVLDPSTGNVWQSLGPLSRRDYESLPIDSSWIRVGIGTGAMDEHWFARSPGADSDGPMEQLEIGRHRFGLCARPQSAPIRAHGSGGPMQLLVEKHHVLRFAAERDVSVLELADGQRFVHVIEGGPDKAALALPDGWRLHTLGLVEDWVVTLPTPTSVFFFANGDSYQGPLAALPA